MSKEKHIAIGTWNKCQKDGIYWEYKISKNYTIMLSTKSYEISAFKINLIDNGFIISEFKNGDNLIINNDTLILTSKSENKIVLKSTYTNDNYEFYRAEFKIPEIDSSNLGYWKKNALTEFKKRALLKNCPDIRSEKEKNLPTLNLDELEEEEISIEIIKK